MRGYPSLSTGVAEALETIPPRTSTVLPSITVIYAVSSFVRCYETFRALTLVQPDSSGNSHRSEQEGYVRIGRRQLILVLQLLVGALVTFGGAAYVLFAVNSLGIVLGAGHLLVGLAGLSIGALALSRKDLPRSQLLGVNVVTVVYSLVSDGAAGALTLLPTSAFHDSLIGTVIAVIVSSTVLYLLAKKE